MTDVAPQLEPLQEPRPAALEEAFAQYQGELLGTLYYLVGNIEDARDALQETFIKCWRHRDQVASVRDLKAWIFRIALNTGRDMRQTAWRRKRKGLAEEASLLESPQEGPQMEAERNEQLARLREAIKQLREQEQEVFLLRQNGQLKYEEIATAVGIPVGTVKTRMRMALARLRHVLGETAPHYP